ncbi:hypothetical protein SAMN05216257_102300 [Meinhardsimonia xiamenensis]|jgi:hypothetical protein|uniref:Uncharacterized protein n=1 Tax=Meinhardsimonia xiamenensis TaxID=990712 RepID=A0A1G9AW66_9RHOB|nr:DUF1178 family protein [Meinhardsimonia xiamenensis]PRX35224.1 hypothetical protein LV81_01819 [Meinhardsimonia xiamenensis]SDK31531.1 hypothetical protein SAMN05216257_102300 [Meinhardsimonia xiamenensis]
MIRYALKCDTGHEFESWFQSADAFDGLKASGMVACPACGSTAVEKALMAPQIRPSRKRAAADGPVPEERKPLTGPRHPVEEFLRALRRKVEENCDYVGRNFATEARAIHLGEAPERPIYGEAAPEEARELLEEGVPIAPLPFIGPRNTN